MVLGCDWKMKLGFGGFSDSDLKNENGGRRAEVWDDTRLMDMR